MTIPTKSQVIFGIQTCCVCGLSDCSQSIDHQYFPLQELIKTIQQNKKEARQIDQLKTDVRNKFLKLRRQLFAMLKSKQESIVKWLNSFYFLHLNDLGIQNVSIFCDVLENDFSKLPNRKISKTIKSLQRQNKKKKDQKLEVQSIRNDIRQLLSRMQIEKITKSIQLQLSVQKILKKQSSIKLSKSNKSTKSQATTASEKKIELSPVLQTYEWKYIRFTRNTKSADLNNRSITDEDMIKQLPIISTFTNIRQLEIRNNKITALTCNIVANSMRFLTVLDLRGNKVGDAGVGKVVTAISGLKSLFVSETGITDVTGDLVAGNLHDLETFWSEHTKLTGISSRKICKKPKLRLLSLIGNPIEQHDKEELKALFISKGYLNI